MIKLLSPCPGVLIQVSIYCEYKIIDREREREPVTGEMLLCLHSPTGINKVLLSCPRLFFRPFLNGPRAASQGRHLPGREKTKRNVTS